MRKLLLLLLTLLSSQTYAAWQASDPYTQVMLEREQLVDRSVDDSLRIAARKDGTNRRNDDRAITGRQLQAKQKRCLTVCKNWGEDCVENPRTGARKCRRTCKEFAEECF